MILSIFGELEEAADKFKKFLTEDGHQYYIAVIFVVLLLVFMFGFNSMHKNDK